MGCSSSQTAPAWVLPWGAVLQEQTAPAWVPTGSQALPANLLQRGLLSSWVCRSWQEPAPAQGTHGVTASFGHPPAPAWGLFHRLQVQVCFTVDLHGLPGDSLPHHGFHHKREGSLSKGRLFALASRAAPPPSFFTDLGVCRIVSLTSSHSSL